MKKIYRTCSKCKIERSPDDYTTSSMCRKCRNEYTKLWRKNNPEKWQKIYKKANKKYEGKNKEKLRERKRLKRVGGKI